MSGETPTKSHDAIEYLHAGHALQQAGRLDEAIAAFRRAIELKPDYADAFTHLGIALHHGEQTELAMQAFEKAVALDPASAPAQSNLGRALRLAGRCSEAIAAFEKSLAIRPLAPQVWANLSSAMLDCGQTQQAIDACKKALELDPNLVSAYNGLGNAVQASGRFEQAIAAYQKSLSLRPASALAYSNLGNALRDSGRINEAIDSYRRAVEIDPKLARAHSNLLATLHFSTDLDQASIRNEYRRWSDLHAKPLQDQIIPATNDHNASRRLRIGYVSPDFRDHSVARFFPVLIEHHDSRQVEVTCYADLRSGPDAITQEIHRHAHRWRTITGLSDHRVAEIVREDQIDILVDLAGHTARNRLLVFARKPAPIQVTYLGYPNTTGLESIDYCLTDAHLDPPGVSESQFTEQLVRLPRTFACYQPPRDAPDVVPTPALKNGYMTFGSFNNLAKLNDGVLSCWARILRGVPGARMLLIAKGLEEPAIIERMQAAFTAHGVDPNRLTFLGFQTRPQYMACHNEVDIALDPFPVNGHTTTCNALWMGVPVITLAGDSHCGRMGVSVLNNLGLSELVASDRENYVQLAIALTKDVFHLQELRSTMRQTMKASPLMDTARFARDIEDAYRTMWRRWCDRRMIASKDSRWMDLAVKTVEQHLSNGELEQAGKVCRQMLDAQPRNAKAIFFLGMVELKKDNARKAIRLFDESLGIDPNDPMAIYHKATAMLRLNQYREAIPILEQLIAQHPGQTSAYSGLGLALFKAGRREEAMTVFAKSSTLGLDRAVHQRNLAKALLRCGLHDEVIIAARRAIALKPNWHEPYLYMGQALHAIARRVEAIEAFRKSHELKPDWFQPHSNILYAMHFEPGLDAQAIRQEHDRWNQAFALPLQKEILPHFNDRDPDRRLRIGYVSPNFRDHVIGRNLLPVFRHHDHTQFEIICYAEPPKSDSFTKRFQACAEQWRDVLGMSDQALADRIRQDKIDILVDLNLHLADARLLVFARKPAPVQVTFAGYPASTGLTTIDYRLTDPYMDPPGENDANYSEQSIRLPNSFWCYDPLGDDPPVNPLPADENGWVTFGCMNNFCKVNDGVLAMWRPILHALPDSRLLILAPAGTARSYIVDRLEIAPERVEFLDRQSHVKYMRTYNRIDIALDTFPYNSHTTGLDAMWMGVPIINRCGQTAVSRAGFSQATNLGLTELVAYSDEQFVKIAVDLAHDLPRLRELRTGLRQRMQKSVLTDCRLFAKHLEEAYRVMWRRWCETGDPSTMG